MLYDARIGANHILLLRRRLAQHTRRRNTHLKAAAFIDSWQTRARARAHRFAFRRRCGRRQNAAAAARRVQVELIEFLRRRARADNAAAAAAIHNDARTRQAT